MSIQKRLDKVESKIMPKQDGSFIIIANTDEEVEEKKRELEKKYGDISSANFMILMSPDCKKIPPVVF